MIVLHIAYINHLSYLWGEASAAGGGIPEPGNPEMHPSDLGEEGIRRAVKKCAAGVKVYKKNLSRQYMRLPARQGVPFPSTPLLGREAPRRGKRQVQAFGVTALQLSLEDVLEVAAASRRQAPGILFGPSWEWTRAALMQSINMDIKQNYLPSLLDCGYHFEARWLPLPDEEDEAAWRELTLALPAECRAMADSPRDIPYSAEVTVERVLDYWTDRMARMAWRTEGAEEAEGAEGADGRDVRGGRRKTAGTATNIHDAWLQALVSRDGVLRWPEQRAALAFARDLENWRRMTVTMSRSPYRFCMRLNEPAASDAMPGNNDAKPGNNDAMPGKSAAKLERGAAKPLKSAGKTSKSDNGSWRVEYLIQSKKDASLLIPIADAMKARSPGRKALGATLPEMNEFVLTVLGQAAGYSEGVSGSLRVPGSTGFELDHGGAFHFLTSEVPALQDLGITLMLPAWWLDGGKIAKPALRIKAASPKMKAKAQLSLEALVDYDVRLALGGMELSVEEIKALARLKEPLVQVRGQWMLVDQQQLARALAFLEKGLQMRISARQALTMGLNAESGWPGLPGMSGLPVESVDLDGWLGQLAEQLQGRQELQELPPPAGFRGDLRPYQKRGYTWLDFQRRWGLGACLADDMGLGKTIQALAIIQKEREAGESRPVLLVCPTSVVNNWKKEAERFTPDLPMLVHHGSDRRKMEHFKQAASHQAIVVSTYSLLQKDIAFIQDIHWAGVILDEAQNIKNPETRQARAARALQADYRVALTGTPVENHAGELWSLMEFLNPGLLGSQGDFKNRYHRPIQIYNDEEAARRLKTVTGPFIMRRLKTDRSIISDLPDKVEIKEYCTLTREQASLYQAVVDDTLKKIESSEGIERKGLVLATLTRLKQVCNHPAHFMADGSPLPGRSGKLERLMEIMEQVLERGEKTLVFTQYAEMGAMLQTSLQEHFAREALFLHGGLSKKKRDEMVARFQGETRGPDIFILSLKAGGSGLNLVEASNVVHFDRWWNPAVENQATDRAFRIGQTRNVMVHKFIVAGTLEERIDEMMERKSALAGQIVGTGEKWLSELSNAEIRNLIALGPEARGE